MQRSSLQLLQASAKELLNPRQDSHLRAKDKTFDHPRDRNPSRGGDGIMLGAPDRVTPLPLNGRIYFGVDVDIGISCAYGMDGRWAFRKPVVLLGTRCLW